MKTDLLFSSYPFISCEKVTLSRITDMDLELLWEIMGDDENYRFNPNGAARNKQEVLSNIIAMDTLFKEKKIITLGIFSNDSLNKLLGTMEIFDFNYKIKSLSIRLLLGQTHHGLGYASAAINATVKYLFELVGVNRVQAHVMPTNYHCQRLLERCGFIKEGTIREGFLWPDKGLVDLTLYSMLSSDYRKHHQKTEQGHHCF